MNKRELTLPDLERFVILFLPERKLDRKTSNLELKAILRIVINALELIDFTITINDLFNAFRNLSYHISVVEPQREESEEQPYSDTNSHAIYIGIDLYKLEELSAILPNIDDKGNVTGKLLQDYAKTVKIYL